MQEPDGNLLQRFAAQGDEAAFEALAARYLGLIFHTAMRRTGSRPIAEEVSQNVLCALAKKASTLARNSERLPAWLHRATLFESSKAMRKEASNQRRKELRHPDQIEPTHVGDDSHWHAALPHLDEALDRLSESERSVVLKHYFEGLGFGRIGEQLSRPAATVQKQCRRAIDKLARILRGKGVALSAVVLASGLGTQLAKAAPMVLLKSATATALGGVAAYSTTQLMLFMAMKSKFALPLAIAVLVTPLVLQQVAISRVGAHNAELRVSMAGDDSSAVRSRSPRAVAVVTAPAGRVTIEQLRQAYSDAQRLGMLKSYEFEEMLASLDGNELAELIPQAFKLPVLQQERRNLLEKLIGALTDIDPEQAVRVTCEADPKKPFQRNLGVEYALYRWASDQPDEAIDWLKQLKTGFCDGPNAGSEVWLAFLDFQAPVLSALIETRSSRVRELLTLHPDVRTSYLIRDAISRPTPHAGAPAEALDTTAIVNRFETFLPWIREFVSTDRDKGGFDRAQALGQLLLETSDGRYPGDGPIAGQIMKTVDLLPSERRRVAEHHAAQVISTRYNTRPRPDRNEVDAVALQWLETYVPEQAEEIFDQTNARIMANELRQIEYRLDSLERRGEVRDSDIIQELERPDFSEFDELLPRAIMQTKRIKDATQRQKLLDHLQNQSNPHSKSE